MISPGTNISRLKTTNNNTNFRQGGACASLVSQMKNQPIIMIKKSFNLLSGLVAVSSMLLSACTDKTDFDVKGDTTSGDKNIVTISFAPQAQSVSTRDDEDTTDKISDGKKVDVLIFAVYHSDTQNGEYTLAEEFQKSEIPVQGIKPGKGQNIIKVDPKTWPFQIQLVVDPDKYYKVAAWSQNSEFKAYDASDLQHIRVNYSGETYTDDLDPGFGVPTNDAYLNNNELSDAFCGVSSHPFKGDNPNPQEVILHRPFAQINIGTPGWDYEGTALLEPHKAKYMWSAVRIKNIAQVYDVVNGVAVTKDKDGNSLLTEVYFDFDYLPAYYHFADANDIEKTSATDITNDELLYVRRGDYVGHEAAYNIKNKDLDFYQYFTWHRYFNFKAALSDKETDPGYNPDDQFKDKYYQILTDDKGGEKIVEVELKEGEDPEEKGYFTTSQLFEMEDRRIIFTEIYKYMSMCYVLVPEAVDDQGNPTGSTVDVEFCIKGKTYTDYDENGKKVNLDTPTGLDRQTKWYTINHVPVQKNWRTNIIGEGFLMVNHKFNFYVIPDYCGEYDAIYDEDDKGRDSWKWNMDWAGEEGDNDWGLNGGGYIYDDFNTRLGEDYTNGLTHPTKPYNK